MEMNIEKSESESESPLKSYTIKKCVINYSFKKQNNRPIELILTDGTKNLKKRNSAIICQFSIFPNVQYEKNITCFSKDHILRLYYNSESHELSSTAQYDEITSEFYNGKKIFIPYDITINLNLKY